MKAATHPACVNGEIGAIISTVALLAAAATLLEEASDERSALVVIGLQIRQRGLKLLLMLARRRSVPKLLHLGLAEDSGKAGELESGAEL